MSDLVQRLRAEDPETGLRHSIASEAADHIEELNGAFEAYATEMVALIDKLEAALRFYAEYTPKFSQQDFRAVARAALEGKN